MAMGPQIPRDAVHIGSEIGAVIEIEAAQEVLVGLAAAGMLGGNQARHNFQQFSNPQQGSNGQVSAPDGTLAGRICGTDQLFGPPEDDDLLDLINNSLGFGGNGCGGGLRMRQSRQMDARRNAQYQPDPRGKGPTTRATDPGNRRRTKHLHEGDLHHFS